MDFLKIYDNKINEELKKYEKLQWEMYYRTLLPERMQQFEQEYTGTPEDKEQAMKQHKAELMAKHAGRIQRLLNQKREKLTVECLEELIDRLETAQHEADQDAEIKKLKEELLKARNDAKAFEDDWEFCSQQKSILMLQIDIINFALKIFDYKCLKMALSFVKAAYNQQPPEKDDEQEVEE